MSKVSVIIPCYNAMKFLPRTVRNVLAQTHQDFEIIIVNDGSTDNIEQWVSTLNDERVCLISQLNQGQSAARNRGIKYSSGKYIAFLDSDDLWNPQKLEKQVRILDNNPEIGLVYSWVLLIDECDRPLEKVWKISDEGNVWSKLIEGNIIACGSVPMIRSSCIDVVGLFNKFPFACEDWDFWLRIAAHYPFKVIKEILVYYRANSTSLSRSQLDGLEKKLLAMDKSYEILIEKTFDSAPLELQYLKSRSHALAKLSIAWKALKSPGGKHEYVEHYLNRAIFYDPQFSSSSELKKFKKAAFVVRFLGIKNYEKTKNSFRRVTSLSRKILRLEKVSTKDTSKL